MRGIQRETRLLAMIVAAVLVAYWVTQVLLTTLDPTLPRLVVNFIESGCLAAGVSTAVWFGVMGRLHAQAAMEGFQRALHQALEMTRNETAAYDVVARAIDTLQVEGHAQLLLADSSEAHLKPTAATGDTSLAGCTVTAPFDCPAIRRGQTSSFDTREPLSACPWLLDARSEGEEVTATCVPVNVVGRSIGVLHLVSTPPPSRRQVNGLEAIAEHCGARIGMHRVMEKTYLQAATDPLTGLLNRRSLENRLHELIRSRTGFALAMADLDHFKHLNDTHGHDVGDRALRVFSRTLGTALRSNDVIARYGGEEFVIVFPEQTANQAVAALERVREALALAATTGQVPPFTASFGVTDSHAAESIEELLHSADLALFRAKREGRNRVVGDFHATPDHRRRAVGAPEAQPPA